MVHLAQCWENVNGKLNYTSIKHKSCTIPYLRITNYICVALNFNMIWILILTVCKSRPTIISTTSTSTSELSKFLVCWFSGISLSQAGISKQCLNCICGVSEVQTFQNTTGPYVFHVLNIDVRLSRTLGTRSAVGVRLTCWATSWATWSRVRWDVGTTMAPASADLSAYPSNTLTIVPTGGFLSTVRFCFNLRSQLHETQSSLYFNVCIKTSSTHMPSLCQWTDRRLIWFKCGQF